MRRAVVRADIDHDIHVAVLEDAAPAKVGRVTLVIADDVEPRPVHEPPCDIAYPGQDHGAIITKPGARVLPWRVS